jgi:hypothetical protein
MTKAQARKLVEDGLTLRKERREAAENEIRMEAYEKEMITFCNGNCANARKNREKDAETALALVLEENRKKEEREQMIAFRKREREQLRMEMERDAKAMDALRRFVFFCLVTALVTVWSPFPWWAAVALVVGCTALVAAYIFRVYFPVQ